MSMRGQLARGAVATRLVLLLACELTACVDGRASLGRFADERPPLPPPPPSSAGVGGAGPAGATAPPPVPDAGHPFEPAPPALLDAGTVQLPEPAPPVRACAAGSYRGDFICALRTDGTMQPGGQQPGGQPPPPMMASLPFGLEPSADGSYADVVDGDFMFVAWGVGFTGRFEGRLGCESGRFSAIIVDGMTGPLFMGGPSTFVGALDGRLDPVTGMLEGTWWHGPMQGSGCTGTWTALPQAP